MLEKIRVHELAKDLNMTSKDIITILEQFGISVKGYMTVLEENQLDIIFESLSQKYDKGGKFNILNSTMEYGKIVRKEEPKPEPVQEVKKEEKPAEEKKEEVKEVKEERVKKPSNPHPFEKSEKKKQAQPQPKKERVNVVVNTRSEAIDVNRIEKVEEKNCFLKIDPYEGKNFPTP